MKRAFLGLVKKEFIQVFRDPNMLRLIFLMPVIQLILFGYVVNLDVKKLDLDVYDFNQTEESRELINSTRVNDYFIPMDAEVSVLNLDERFQGSKSDMAVIIPPDFSKKLVTRDDPTISLVADGSNANSTSVGSGYFSRILQRFTFDYYGIEPIVDVRFDMLYNPEERSVNFMIPGIVAILLTMITVMLTSMAIVREREVGTLEQLMVTPMTSFTFLLGKIAPFAVLGLFEIIFALIIGIIWFSVPFVGSPLLLFILCGVYLLTTLGIGLFISTMTSTQQQAMFFAWFFSVFAIMTSGFFTPISNMPEWMQYITYINPMRYFLDIVRAIMMKGAGISQILKDVYPMIIYGVVTFGLAMLRFNKRTS